MTGNLFDLNGKVAIITGGGGLLGTQHAHAIASAGGNPIIVDILPDAAKLVADDINRLYRNVDARAEGRDATSEKSMIYLRDYLVQEFGHIDILVNNLASNPTMTLKNTSNRLESFGESLWDWDMDLGLKSAFICSKVFGTWMAEDMGGVIVNIASDLSVIAPDQRLYLQDGIYLPSKQPVKPVTYSVVKHGLIGLTKYLAAYWADRGVRVNALSPGGIFNDQPEGFVDRISHLIPMGRMAWKDEMRGALIFLCSRASSYMTGQNVIVDGGRTII